MKQQKTALMFIFCFLTVTLAGLLPVRAQEILVEDGHQYIVSYTDPDCTEPGYKILSCILCYGVIEYELSPALGHTYAITVIKAPSCTEMGLSQYTCTLCGDSYRKKTDVLPSHQYTAVVTKPASCIEPGMTTHECADCGDAYRQETPQTAHHYSVIETAPTCTQKGEKQYVCDTCFATHTEEFGGAAGHHYKESILKQPTCSGKGEKQLSCTECGESHEEPFESEPKHDYRVETLQKDGKSIKTYACKTCGTMFDTAETATENETLKAVNIAISIGNAVAFLGFSLLIFSDVRVLVWSMAKQKADSKILKAVKVFLWIK